MTSPPLSRDAQEALDRFHTDMMLMTPEERVECIASLHNDFCKGCGRIHTNDRCHCEDDS